MSSFIATAPAAAGQNLIANDGFFPDIDVDQALAAMRQDGTVTPDRLRAALIEAALSINAELAGWKASQQAAGHATLLAVPAAQIDGKSTNQHRYIRALHCQARAGLIERYRDYDATAAGDKAAEALLQAVEDLRRDARWAISDLLGITRTTVELI
ncbi:head completion/stabilization protein [Cupriavidus sp. AcVe19-1a]|uniref:head completion/stabilization protein n=1 Tax=Cupriavidus sp. AcVe19-1a TaxID=2821359 RepID=UPI001AE6DF32|nr:head completion/stabilization protein [Cupriavidus sp. AcVe19-1a]MBP0633282.1 head completion/stabilization protein [Cupriavidus sp. AcVe19-1a]